MIFFAAKNFSQSFQHPKITKYNDKSSLYAMVKKMLFRRKYAYYCHCGRSLFCLWRIVAIEELSAISRAKGAVQFSTDPSIMYGNESETMPYVSWHCDDFINCDNALLSVTCQKCQAEITFSTGVISKCVKKDADSDYLGNNLPSTFHKWLALQENRNDRIGDFAKEFRETKKAERQGKISTTAPKNSNDYIAMQEYVSLWKNSWTDLFQIAWHEYLLLRNK